jgi:hypothetical protein
MTDYKRKRWSAMVSKARRQLAGSCPLQEDETIVWAAERINALEATVRVCRHHCRPIFGAAHPVTHAINDVMGVKR